MEELDAYERRFRRAGLPLLIDGWSAREDALPRAFPLLAFVFLGELLGALNLTWSPLANLGALAAALGLLLGAVALTNKVRGRPATALPRDLGPLELTIFVVVPALLPLLFGGQVTSALVTAGANLVLVALAAFGFGFGVLAILTWALRRVVGQLAKSLLLLARAVPLLLLFAVVLFLTTEMWQTFAEIDDGSLIAVAALLVAVGTLFLLVRLPREVEALERDAGQRAAAHARPAPERRARDARLAGPAGADRQRGHRRLLRRLRADRDRARAAPGLDPDRRAAHRAARARAHGRALRVSAAIAALSGLYYAIAVLTDATYREEFLEEITVEMRETFAARGEYLARRATVRP